MIRRPIQSWADESFDLIVVGGGIYGAWTAYDAALRGLHVALIEKNDWASGTSSASSKLIHGGLRYLEQGRLGLVRKALKERDRLTHLGPHRVQPLRFAVPLTAQGGWRRWPLQAGLWLYDRLAGVSSAQKHTMLSSAQACHTWPMLRTDQLVGGATYLDSQSDDSRLVIELIDGAVEAGACVASRVSATGLIENRNGHLAGVAVHDQSSGARFDLHADHVVLATGPWGASGLSKALDVPMRLSKGVHLVLPGMACDQAFVLRAPRDRRVFFMIPWYGRTLLGTTDTDYVGDPAQVAVESSDVTYLLEAANAYRYEPWTESDICGAMAGVRALADTRSTPSPSQASREWQWIAPRDGLWISLGGKLTSARADVEKMVDHIMQAMGHRSIRRPTRDRALPWAPQSPFGSWLEDAIVQGQKLGLDAVTSRTLALRHGRHVQRVWDLILADPNVLAPVHPELPFVMAEIAVALIHEDAQTLTDVLRRRVPVGLLAKYDAAWLDPAAAFAGRIAGWDAERLTREKSARISP